MRIVFALFAFGLLGSGYALALQLNKPASITVELPPARDAPKPGFNFAADPDLAL